MPSWKKVIISGSKAALSNVTSSYGIKSDYIEHTAGRASVSGILFDSSQGDGNTDIDFIIRGSSQQTIDSSNTDVKGGLKLSGTSAGTDNTVLVLNSSDVVKTDEIDSRVWGSTLLDGTNGTNNEIAIFTDSNSVLGLTALTFDGSTLTVDGDVSATGEVEGSDNVLWCANIYFTNKATDKMNIGNFSYGWNHHNWTGQITSASTMTVNRNYQNCGVQVPYNLKKIKLKGQVRPSADSPTIKMMVFVGDRSNDTTTAVTLTEVIHVSQTTTAGRFKNFDGEATVDIDEGQLLFIGLGFPSAAGNTNAIKGNFTISGTRRIA
tara:strand:+ start:491 stop:1453 length:963 start_codon:yes stop_codon:yes gene_type:complete